MRKFRFLFTNDNSVHQVGFELSAAAVSRCEWISTYVESLNLDDDDDATIDMQVPAALDKEAVMALLSLLNGMRDNDDVVVDMSPFAELETEPWLRQFEAAAMLGVDFVMEPLWFDLGHRLVALSKVSLFQAATALERFSVRDLEVAGLLIMCDDNGDARRNFAFLTSCHGVRVPELLSIDSLSTLKAACETENGTALRLLFTHKVAVQGADEFFEKTDFGTAARFFWKFCVLNNKTVTAESFLKHAGAWKQWEPRDRLWFYASCVHKLKPETEALLQRHDLWFEVDDLMDPRFGKEYPDMLVWVWQRVPDYWNTSWDARCCQQIIESLLDAGNPMLVIRLMELGPLKGDRVWTLDFLRDLLSHRKRRSMLLKSNLFGLIWTHWRESCGNDYEQLETFNRIVAIACHYLVEELNVDALREMAKHTQADLFSFMAYYRFSYVETGTRSLMERIYKNGMKTVSRTKASEILRIMAPSIFNADSHETQRRLGEQDANIPFEGTATHTYDMLPVPLVLEPWQK